MLGLINCFYILEEFAKHKIIYKYRLILINIILLRCNNSFFSYYVI